MFSKPNVSSVANPGSEVGWWHREGLLREILVSLLRSKGKTKVFLS